MKITFIKIMDGSVQECYADGKVFAEVYKTSGNVWHGKVNGKYQLFMRETKNELMEVLVEEYNKLK